MSVRIKICGITTVEDALVVAEAGVDAVGLNFHPASVRAVTAERAREICAALPPFVTTVGLFVDAPPSRVAEVLAAVPLHMLQFHGDETPAACAGTGRPWLKAVRMREDLDVAAVLDRYAGAVGHLLDAYVPGVPGGTGTGFDWNRVPQRRPRPLVLAGGLTAENVGEAIRRVRPIAVDVSGGVERAGGVKDAALVRAFVDAVREASLEPIAS